MSEKLNISQQIKNFINKNKDLIQQSDWVELFEEALYELTKWERADLALILKDSGIAILIEDVFNKEYGYTNYIEDDMSTSITSSMLKELNASLDLDYSGDLKGYPFNEVLKQLMYSYFFTPELKDYYRDYKDDSSPIVEFKYFIAKPGDGYGNLIGLGIIVKSKNNNRIKVVTNGLRENFIDYREGFGLGYNKSKLEKYIEEKHFTPLLGRLG